jgi:hypothetical protein
MTDISQRETLGFDGIRPSRDQQPESCASVRRRAVKHWAMVVALAVAVALLAVAAAACGDGGNGGDASPTGPAASPTGEAGLPAPCQALASLKSYRYVTEMTLESPVPTGTPSPDQPTPTATITRDFTGPFLFEYDVEASFVAPDRLEANVTGSTSPMSVIIIGDRNWIEAGAAWRESASPINVTYGPMDVCKAVLPDLDLSQAQPQAERRNDVDTLHYTFSQASSDATAELFGQESDMAVLLGNLDVELWLAKEDNHLVRIEVQSTGLYADSRELRLRLVDDVAGANDDSIRVEPPT